MTEKRSSGGNAAEVNGVSMERVIDAPRATVFKVWTEPKHVEQWWGPHHFTNRVRKWDARPGGAIDIDMISPDGTVFPMTGTFQEVSEPERLVFKSAVPGPDGKPLFEVVDVITFSEKGGRTIVKVDVTVTSRTDAAAQFLAGMEAGWTQTLDRLDAFAKGVGGTK